VSGYVVEFYFFVVIAKHVEEIVPDLATTGNIERRIVKGKLDAGFESLVEGANAIRCQDQHTIIVLQGAKEH
jgi:hypothetical protein